jgi:hypothetical protein
MRGGQITSLECALLLVGIGGLTVVIRASRRARDMDVAQSIDVLLECLKPEHGGGGGDPVSPYFSLCRSRIVDASPGNKLDSRWRGPQPCWPSITDRTGSDGSTGTAES